MSALLFEVRDVFDAREHLPPDGELVEGLWWDFEVGRWAKIRAHYMHTDFLDYRGWWAHGHRISEGRFTHWAYLS